MRRSWRWSLALLLAPFAVEAGWLFGYPHLSGWVLDWVGTATLWVTGGTSVLGLHLLPLRWPWRVATACVVLPLMAGALVANALVFGCMLNGDCL